MKPLELNGHSLFERAMSSFPVSIGTGLALESIHELHSSISAYDEDRDFEKFSLKDYTSFYFNLETLFRNMSSSVDSKVFLSTDSKICSEVLLNEIYTLRNIFQGDVGDVFNTVFYYSTYEDLIAKSKKLGIVMRTPNTENQRVYRLKFVETINSIIKQDKSIIKTNGTINPTVRDNALIMSHLNYDLLSYTGFKRLDLLESHTGKLKTRSLWNSRLFPLRKGNIDLLPFNLMTVLVFGDKHQIQPYDFKLRELIYDMAVKRNWNPNTTMDKIKFDINLDIKEPMVKDFLINICRSK